MEISSKDLTDAQKEVFIETFYLESTISAEDEKDTHCPWSCPWYHGRDVMLVGDTVEDMAIHYAGECAEEIQSLLEEEEAEREEREAEEE